MQFFDIIYLLIGSLSIEIIVTDVNDNGPQFVIPLGLPGLTTSTSSDRIEARVTESSPAGTPIMRLTATDPDSGINGRVTYRLSDDTRRDFGDLFAVDSTSGLLYTRTELDAERQSVYVVSVMATDNADLLDERRSTQTTIAVRVDDVNDNVPTIRVNGLTPNTPRPTLIEHSGPGTFVAHLSVDDPDSGQNGRFRCHVTTGSDLFELQQMHATEFKLVVTSSASPITIGDSGADIVLRVVVVCRDNGVPEMSSSLPIEVAVVPRNEHAPSFGRSEYRFDLLENSRPGTAIGRVMATDMDKGPAGRVVYRIENDDGAPRGCPVDINPHEGVLAVSSSDNGDVFDRESTPECRLDVIASDRGDPAKSARVRVILTVLDVDDEPVRFDSDAVYKFIVAENQPAGTEVKKSC